MSKDIKLKLKDTSWENIFYNIRNNSLTTEGNFWAAIQHLEEQHEKCTSQGVCDVDDVTDPRQISLFNQN